ncbi:MAG: type II secretion system secretin GspD [Proteobacteria bacterium]|nr:type II secretion system secretin GspD [Pseudomonadota bacterium]
MNIRNTISSAVLISMLISTPVVRAQEQTWKINIKNADIHEFITQVAEITGRTFVLDPRLKGSVTIISDTNMDADAVYELFLTVLRVYNFTVTASGDNIRIEQTNTAKQSPGMSGDLNDIPDEQIITRVIPAQNVDSQELMKILRPLIPQHGNIAALTEPNVVVVSDHAGNLRRLMELIRQIDISDSAEIVVVQLKEAWVGEVVTLLERVAPSRIGQGANGPQKVQIFGNERNNSMVVRGNPRSISEILKLVELLDQPATSGGAIHVVRLKHADAAAVAELLTNLLANRSTSDSKNELAIAADDSLNAIVIRADPSAMNEVLNLVEELDVRRAQVLIEAAIVEVDLTDSIAIGVEFAGVDREGGSVPLFTTSLNGVIGSLLGDLVTPAPTDGGGISDAGVLTGLANASTPTLAAVKLDPNGISFAAVVTALATNSNANLLSTPSIVTLDNMEAKIVVGNEVPFRTGSFATTGDGSSNPFTTVQREDVGLQLTVTPHVHDGSAVRLEVSQEITNVVPSPIGDNGFADVVTSKREIQTTVLADDRQIVVLGGLIQDDITESIRKVPLLGDIPFLGVLFRSTVKERTKKNLLVFLRPTVIKSKTDADAVTIDKYRDIWEVEISSEAVNEDLDDIFRGRR